MQGYHAPKQNKHDNNIAKIIEKQEQKQQACRRDIGGTDQIKSIILQLRYIVVNSKLVNSKSLRSPQQENALRTADWDLFADAPAPIKRDKKFCYPESAGTCSNRALLPEDDDGGLAVLVGCFFLAFQKVRWLLVARRQGVTTFAAVCTLGVF